MISVVLVLLLVAAIARIFGTTSETIGRSEAIVRATTDLEAVRTALQADFTGTDDIAYLGADNDQSGMLPIAGVGAIRDNFTGSQTPQPSIILYSSRVGTYLNERESESDALFDITAPFAGTPPELYTVDSDGDGVDDTTLSRFDYGIRSFRTDTLSFFTGGSFTSQTNLRPGGDVTDAFNSDQAWVWWGHGRAYNGLVEPNQALGYAYPGFIQTGGAQNTNNRFASEFRLLRMGMLLSKPIDHDGDDPTGTGGAFTPATVANDALDPVYHLGPTDAGTDDWSRRVQLFPIFDRPTASTDWSDIVNGVTTNYPRGLWFDTDVNSPDPEDPGVGPFSQLTNTYFLPDGATDHIFLGPPDVLTIVTADAYDLLEGRVDVLGASADQFHDFLLAMQAIQPRVSLPLLAPASGDFGADADPWYDDMLAVRASGAASTQVPNRFWINPIARSPLDPNQVNQRSSLLLDGAAQFTVEFAGDFFTQDTTGAITAAVPDGTVDFYLEVLNPTGPVAFRKTRFYGLPRDVDGDPDDFDTDGNLVEPMIYGPGAVQAGAAFNSPGFDARTDPDVRPVADYLVFVGGVPNINHGFPFEKLLPGPRDGNGNPVRDAIEDYIFEARSGDGAFAADYEDEWSQYLCAWGPMELASGSFFAGVPFSGQIARNYPGPWVSFNTVTQPLSPKLFRFIVEAADVQGRLDQAVRTELVFTVPHVTN